LTDYVDAATLQRLQDIVTQVTGAQIRLYGADGQPVTQASVLVDDPADMLEGDAPPRVGVVVDGELVGRIVLEKPAPAGGAAQRLEQLAAALEVEPGKLRAALAAVGAPDSSDLAARQMLALTAEVIRRLCDQERQLRDRIEELTTLYKLTTLFAAQLDLAKVLDTVVKTVVDITGVKAAAIRLLDRETNELAIEAVTNLSDEYLAKGRILLRDSVLDRQAFETGEVVYVEDEQNDPRVLYPAEAKREGIRSALIAPLIYKGLPVGALRVYTGQVKRFSRYEISLVKAIADQAAAAIVNAQLHEETLRARDLQRQLQTAAVVQRRMIPAQPPSLPGLDLAAVYVPSLEISGDLYDFIELPEGNLGLTICDVMGKGVPAGLLMAAVRASLRAHVGDLFDLSEILRRVNRSLCADTLHSAFATLFYGVIDLPRMGLTYANAGHEPPLFIRDGHVRPLTSGGTVLGVEPAAVYSRETVKLKRGDVIVMATDGLIEAMNFHDEQFGHERVAAAAKTAVERGLNADGIAKHLLWEMRRFAGLRDRGDDVTLVVVRVI
jgi:sigma-B regulation protein RsbU (phosphoserine phosphatase)